MIISSSVITAIAKVAAAAAASEIVKNILED